MPKSVLVLLPEGKLFDQVLAEAIVPALSQAGATVARPPLDLTNSANESALRDQIKSVDLVIADLTGKNPNVFFGLGLARALERDVLLLATHLEDFPFATQSHPVIGYAGNREFLRQELTSFLSSGQREAPPSQEDARQKFRQTFGDILSKHGYDHRGEIYLENPTTYVLLNQEMELALVQELARRARELGLRLKLM